MRVKTNSTMRIFSPAKVNLLLAVTGKRDNGFHDLVSLVAPLEFGDFLDISIVEGPGPVELSCTNPDVPLGDENLIVRAVKSYREAAGVEASVQIHLEKHIPMEAGLGGGSSNAAVALLALNELNGQVLSISDLSGLAAEIGSDCPLFLHRSPLIMRGRGEKIELLTSDILDRLAGQQIAVFKPGIGISTAWAYGKLAEKGSGYANSRDIEKQLNDWKRGLIELDQILFNSFEESVFGKFIVFQALFERIQIKLNLRPLLSGSGSSCFVLLHDEHTAKSLEALVKEALGESAFFEVTAIRSVK